MGNQSLCSLVAKSSSHRNSVRAEFFNESEVAAQASDSCPSSRVLYVNLERNPYEKSS